MNEQFYFVYIMASISGTLYAGVCRNIVSRALEHKRGEGGAFTRKYKCNRPVYYKRYRYVMHAIRAEKMIKGWKRDKKVVLIESVNSSWIDLASEWGKPLHTQAQSSSAE
jgi:putative endonuclease